MTAAEREKVARDALAEITAAAVGMVETSPAPLAPSGLVLHGTLCVSKVMEGPSAARGSA